MIIKLILIGSLLISTKLLANSNIDCSEAYGVESKCLIVKCDERYSSFIGTWKGPFSVYVKDLSTATSPVYRPYDNTITYSEKDCLQNTVTNDVFIIGRRTDNYPKFKELDAHVETGLLITGRTSQGKPFLRTVDKKNGVVEYSLEYQNKVADLSIWSFTWPAGNGSQEMRFTTIDGRDFAEKSIHKRNVTVTMSMGSKDSPTFEGVIVSGFHSKTDH